MEQRALRKEIFKILFERELIDVNIEKRISEFFLEHNLSENKKEFFSRYINEYILNEDKIVENVILRDYNRR